MKFCTRSFVAASALVLALPLAACNKPADKSAEKPAAESADKQDDAGDQQVDPGAEGQTRREGQHPEGGPLLEEAVEVLAHRAWESVGIAWVTKPTWVKPASRTASTTVMTRP